MLKGIDPLLSPELLRVLRAMGHGDEIAVVDANFPAQAQARELCRADGVGAIPMVRAIISVMPLDDFGPCAAYRMAVVDQPDLVPPIVGAFESELRGYGYDRPLAALDRYAFYERARSAFAIVATGEERLYANLILTKGVVRSVESI